ncbi:MAG: circadian clock protein KaiC [Gemmataceae bacterium]
MPSDESSQISHRKGVTKIPTGIEGLDLVAYGGLPQGRVTLVSGTPGSGKTVLCAQFLVEGICKFGQPGVFVTFEESVDDIRTNMYNFGWDISAWEEQGLWTFIDASPLTDTETLFSGDYDLGGLVARLEDTIRTRNTVRVSIDTVTSLFTRFPDQATIRRELHRLAATLKKLGTTTIVSGERAGDHDEISRHGIEEFVADNVIVLRNVLEQEKRRRTLEILKFRGTEHQKGEYAFTVNSSLGIIVIPLSEIELRQRSTDVRISSGNEVLDQMCGGGFYRDSIILVSGPTGTGKTLITTEFIAGGMKANERCLLLAYEESREQLFRNASGWGIDFRAMEEAGELKVVCQYPEAATLEDQLIAIKEAIHSFKPNRVAIDSLSALERGSTLRMFREFVISLTSFIKDRELAGLFTASTTSLLGGSSITEAHISTITDSIILLRYAELHGEMRRGLTVLKMRGSMHDKNIREFTIDGKGMHIGKPFYGISGILSGSFSYLAAEEAMRLDQLFETPPEPDPD